MARSGDEVAAGDGLGAFGAALIIPVQMHSEASRKAAGQRIYATQSHPRAALKTDQQDRQIQP